MAFDADELTQNLIAANVQQARDGKRGNVMLETLPEFEMPGDVYLSRFAGGLVPVVSETQGRRSAQEDYYTVAETLVRSRVETPDFLNAAFDRIQARVAREMPRGGSTATVVYAGADQTLTAANTGDARSVVFLRDVPSGEVRCCRLTRDHTLEEPEECARVAADGGTVVQRPGDVKRVLGFNGIGGVAPPRAFGDFHFPGVIHTPDLTQLMVADEVADPDREVYLLLACDGLYETLHEHDLRALMEEYLGKGPAECEESLPKIFTDAALYSGSRDNITALMARLRPERTQDVVLGVFDGHGGKDVSRLASQELRAIAHERAPEARQSRTSALEEEPLPFALSRTPSPMTLDAQDDAIHSRYVADRRAREAQQPGIRA